MTDTLDRPGRLTTFARGLAIDALKVPPLAFRRLGAQLLMTGDGGEYAALIPGDFERFLAGGVSKDEPLWKDLQAKGLVKDHIDFAAAARRALERRLLVWAGPNVHHIAVTERRRAQDPGTDMTLETARETVDWIFRTPAAALTLEISGGRPLLNWPLVRFLVLYARLRAQRSERALTLLLDADADLLDEAKLAFLLEQKVRLRFTLDGPPPVHDALAAAWGGAGYEATAAWIRRAVEATSGEHEGFAPKPLAAARVARRSLESEAALIEALVRLGVEEFALEYVGRGSRPAAAGEPLASPEEFAAAYRRAFTHLVKLGLRGKKLRERTALRYLARILNGQQWAYPELEPLDRLGYDPRGGVYAFDAGAEQPFLDVFRVGGIGELTFNAVLNSTLFRAALNASQLEAQPLCSQCAYRPYCGSDPALSLAGQGTLWGRTPANEACRVAMGVFDVLFERVQEWEAREKLFTRWLA